MLWDLILTSYTINSLPVCCSSNKLLKTWLGKAKYFCIQYNSKTKQKPATKIQGCVFLLHWRPHAKFKPFHENFFFHPNRHLAWFCTHPFNWCLNCQHRRMFWGTFVMALSRSWYFTNLSVHKKINLKMSHLDHHVTKWQADYWQHFTGSHSPFLETNHCVC